MNEELSQIVDSSLLTTIVRVKPEFEKLEDDDVPPVISADGSEHVVLAAQHSNFAASSPAYFPASNTLRANAATSELMNVLVAPAVRFMLEGSNCNILSFGAQGSGKTAALFGTEDGMEGFIELVVKHLLSTVSTDSNSHIGMSMWEIRRDVCADLLLDEGAGGCVSDFCVAEFSSVDEFHQVLRRAKNHSANWQDLGSSFAPLPTTAHTVLKLLLVKKRADQRFLTTMHFIDLASPQDPDTPEGRTNLAQLDHFFQALKHGTMEGLPGEFALSDMVIPILHSGKIWLLGNVEGENCKKSLQTLELMHSMSRALHVTSTLGVSLCETDGKWGECTAAVDNVPHPDVGAEGLTLHDLAMGEPVKPRDRRLSSSPLRFDDKLDREDGWFGEYSTGYVSRTSSFHVDMNSEEIARPQEEEGEEEEVEHVPPKVGNAWTALNPSMEALLSVLKDETMLRHRLEERLADVTQDFQEHVIAAGADLDGLRLENSRLRGRLRRLEAASPDAEYFDLCEEEICRLEAEAAGLRQRNATLELRTCPAGSSYIHRLRQLEEEHETLSTECFRLRKLDRRRISRERLASVAASQVADLSKRLARAEAQIAEAQQETERSEAELMRVLSLVH